MNIQATKTDVMRIAVSMGHRMTRFNGRPIKLQGIGRFSALCKDCHRNLSVSEDGTVLDHSAMVAECTGRVIPLRGNR